MLESSTVLKYLTLTYFALLAVLVVAADLGIIQSLLGFVHHIPWGDKTCHFLLVGMLSFLCCANIILSVRGGLRTPAVLVAILAISVLATLEEISQRGFSNRTFSLLDMASNIAGAWTFGLSTLLLPAVFRAVVGALRPPTRTARLG